MKVLFLILLLALAFGSCIALPSLRDCHAITVVAGTIVTGLGGLYLWHPSQHVSDVAPFDSQVPQNGTIPHEHHIDVRVFDSGFSLKHKASVNLRQPRVPRTDENNTTAAYMNSRPTARVVVITDAVNATAPLSPIRANGTNTTINVATELPKDHTGSHNRHTSIRYGGSATLPSTPPTKILVGLAPTIVFRSCFAIVALLVICQVLVYDSNFHSLVCAWIQYLLAKIIWFAIIFVDMLPLPVKATTSTAVLLPAALLPRLCKCFDFRSVRTDTVNSETVLAIYQELKKFNSPRYRQTLEYKKLRALRLMRRNKAKVTFKKAAQEFEEQHDKCRTTFQSGIAVLRHQLFQYSQLESRFNTKSKAAANAGDVLQSHIANISDLTTKLDKAMALVTAALPKSKETFQDMHSLVSHIDKLLRESKSANSKVRHAEEIIKTLYNVDARMKMAPFTNQLESIAKAAAEAQRVIYNAQTAIVSASVAHRTPSQPFESEIVAAKMTLGPAPLSLPSPPTPLPTLPKAVEGPPAPPLAPAVAKLSVKPRKARRSQAPPLVSVPVPHSAPPPAVQRLPTLPLDPASVSLPPSPQPAQRPPAPPLALVRPPPPLTPLAVQRLPPPVLAVPPPPSPPPPKEDAVPPPALAEPNDESMNEAPPVLAPPPPPTPMVDLVRYLAPAEPNDQNMAEAPPVPAPVPQDASMEDALLPPPPPPPVPTESEEKETTEAPTVPRPPPAPPTPAPARAPIPAAVAVAFPPRSVRLNQAGTRPVPQMTRPMRPMPSMRRPVPRITRLKPPASIPACPTPPAPAPTPLPPPTPPPIPMAVPPQSERINQAAVDQVMLTGARNIIRPTPRLKKPREPNSVSAALPPATPTHAPPTPAPPSPAPPPSPPPPRPQQYNDIVNELPPPAPFDAVRRLINSDGDNVDDCLLASRDDDDDESTGSSVDYISDSTPEERERDRRQEEEDDEGEDDEGQGNNGYGSYGNLSDIDSE